ncbi:MAG: TetR/AcrR family transcriptional regulator [Coprococcus sp.]|nr:TetR/AcrR family transcriptional regulator [Coprococcus sp.]
MINKKEDRRIKKTKQLLKQGLIEIMFEKDIKNITIKELVEKVDINRSTFYLHYSDIYELLAEMENNLMAEIWQVFDSYKNIDKLEESYAFILTLYKTFDNNRDLCRAIMSSQNNSAFIRQMEESIEREIRIKLNELIGDESVISDNAYTFYRCGCVGLIKIWITDSLPETPEEMAKETYRIVIDSLQRLQQKK